MPPNPDRPLAEPVIEVLENLAPPHLHEAAWATCMRAGWCFGHGSTTGGRARFWKMELGQDAAFQAIWEHARQRCETLAGGPLKVIRQYANGHTYGMGGDPHMDDAAAGRFTLLYYPNPEWQDGWEGETLFYDADGEIALAVKLRPNRAVFFDSRILHNGTAPSRACTGLRVTVAYKLERIDRPVTPLPPQPTAVPEVPVNSGPVRELERDGARRIYGARVPEETIERAVSENLQRLGESVRLPGFRPGHVPENVLRQQYGTAARADALKRLAAGIVERDLPAGSVASSCELLSGDLEGTMEIRIHATHLPDLPPPDFAQVSWERTTVDNPTPEQTTFLRNQLKQEVLNRLDILFPIPLFPGIVELEFQRLWKSAETQGIIPAAEEERKAMAEEFHGIAGRRLRLGLILAELARRFGIEAANGAELEDKMVDYLAAQVTVKESRISTEQLAEWMRDPDLAR